MAGPWFTVHKSGDDWQRLDQVWISNGAEDCRGHIEIKIELDSNAMETADTRTRGDSSAPILTLQENEQ